MSVATLVAVEALPFVSAAMLAVVGSRPVGPWVNAGSCSLQFLVACTLPEAAASLVLLSTFVAMTTSWYGCRETTLRSLDQRSLRRHLIGYQICLGAVVIALLAGSMFVTWLAVAIAVGAACVTIGVPAAASGLVRQCSVGLVLALLGTLLFAQLPDLAGILVLAGYAVVAGLTPLHAWFVKVSDEAVAPAAILVTTLLPNVPLLLFMRLPLASWLLIAAGLASLLVGAVALLRRANMRRTVAFGGIVQLGLIILALGTGEPLVALLLLTALALARAAVLQSECGDSVAWLTFALLPLYGLHLLAEPIIAVSAWLLLPIAVAVLLAGRGVLKRRAVVATPRTWAAVTPIWLQLALVAVLACAIPAPLISWLRTPAS